MTTVLERTTTATENRRLFPGTIFNIRVSAAESNNAIAIADYEAIPDQDPLLGKKNGLLNIWK